MADKLRNTYEIVSEHMNSIIDLFRPGVKITVLVRTPDHPDRDFMLTSDDPVEALAMIERRISAGAQA